MSNVISLEQLRALFAYAFSPWRRPRFIHVACLLGASYAVLKLARFTRRRLKTTALRGPPNPSLLWGASREIFLTPNSGEIYEKWAEEYGGAYEVPLPFWGRKITLCDPKAIAHMFGGEPWTYVSPPFGMAATETLVGKNGILTATGEVHRRHRKTLTPAFSNAAIRNLTPVFYNSAYKVKSIWDSLIEANGERHAMIEVQSWMNRITLDTIGIAGFSHHFGSLDGKPTTVAEVFDAAAGGKSFNVLIIVLAQALPWLLKLPTARTKLMKRLNDAMGDISNELLAKSRKEKETGAFECEEKSILGLLVRAESQDGQLHLTREEVMAQAKVLLFAGYESTSISLTWALIELSRNPDIQTKLRSELLELGADPSYDQLSNNLPYLDAVVHETLRTHAPVPSFTRMATADDVIPLSKPVRTRSGELVDHITVAKGTFLSVSAASMNCSTALWGLDAKEFKPERWLKEDGIPAGAKEIQGHRHLLTFIDGPRTCLGKGFAITEFKTVLSVLVKNFVFELRDGPETAIDMAMGVLRRPKVAGEEGAAVPMLVRRFE